MRLLVTGSSGHLGEALLRVLGADGCDVVGVDELPSDSTTVVGSIADRAVVRACVAGFEAIVHAATLHKPNVGSHGRRAFVDTNVTGTLHLLEEAVAAGVRRFVFTSTTSAFGRALRPPPGAPAAWIDEGVVPVPRNIYGVTKVAAEDLCELFHRDHGLPCVVLRTSRFFPEGDDRDDVRAGYDDANVKVNELLYRRTTNLPLADVTDGRAWVAHTFAGDPLEPEHCGPARLLVPHLYFWKSAKWVRGLVLTVEDEPGFWEAAGYHNRGDPWHEQRYC